MKAANFAAFIVKIRQRAGDGLHSLPEATGNLTGIRDESWNNDYDKKVLMNCAHCVERKGKGLRGSNNQCVYSRKDKRGTGMIRTWFLATRPWSFTAAAVPIALGAILAWSEGSFSLPLFLLTLVGGIAVQAGTNLINTYGDFITGVDTVDSAKTCSQLVEGIIEPRDMRLAGILTFSFAGIIGLVLTYLCGWPVLAFGLLGIIAGYCYTAGFCPYKYMGLGSILVFFLMGPLMVWPAYYIQTGQLSWLPFWASLPVGFLVAGILHSNDIRDMREDRRAGINTLALFLGVKRSLALYYALYTAAYISLIGLITLAIVPWTAALPIVLVPAIMKLLILANDAVKGSENKLQLLEPVAAKLHLQFGLLLLVGLALHPFLLR